MHERRDLAQRRLGRVAGVQAELGGGMGQARVVAVEVCEVGAEADGGGEVQGVEVAQLGWLELGGGLERRVVEGEQ